MPRLRRTREADRPQGHLDGPGRRDQAGRARDVLPGRQLQERLLDPVRQRRSLCGRRGQVLEYRAAVFAAQPAQEGDGYTDGQLTQFARTAGITGDAMASWQECASSGQYARYVTDVQETSVRDEVSSTPTVKLNGLDVTTTLATPDALVAAVKAASS